MQIKSLLAVTLVISLVGCANHSQDYVEQSGSVSSVAPAGDVKMKTGKNFYVVPGNPDVSGDVKPSLIPPGSHIEPKAEKNSKAVVNVAQWSETTEGQPALILAETGDAAWKNVGRAIKKTPYRVLDKDRSMGSYYIVDSKSTDNKITKATPIYRLYLKKTGQSTQILLLDQHNHPAKSDVVKRILGALQSKLR